MAEDFIERYMQYNWETEPPRIFHRWCAISGVAALLGRGCYLQFGRDRIFPNLYCMIIGDAGTRKSTAIKRMKKIMSEAGYESFSADKTRLEKFLLDLEGATDEEIEAAAGKRSSYDAVMAQNLWGNEEFKEPKECYIAADEWNEFAPRGDIDFCTTLGNFWDWDDENRPFTQRLKNSKSVSIFQPTINILGGNTPDGFTKAFPPEMIGTGFLSRMLLIHGERSGRKYVIPPQPPQELHDAIVREAAFIRSQHIGAVSISEGSEAYKVLETIYHDWEEIDDVRFKSYSNRRFTQLLRLILILIAARGAKQICTEDVVRANTYLSAVEAAMPRALGEFGKSKNSDVANKVMEILKSATKPMAVKDIWAHVHSDLEKIQQLGEILQNLQIAEKVQHISGATHGWLPKRVAKKQQQFVDFSILTEEERVGL